MMPLLLMFNGSNYDMIGFRTASTQPGPIFKAVFSETRPQYQIQSPHPLVGLVAGGQA